MRQTLMTLSGLVAGMIFGDAALAVVSDEARLKSPESEYATALVALENLDRKLDAGRELEKRTGLGPQDAAANRAWEAGNAAFGRGEHLAVIREMNNFLNLVQVPETARYLRAQYMLGRAHDAVGSNTRAMRAFLRYLSSVLTYDKPDHAELLDVLRRLVPLASRDTPGSRAELGQLLSSTLALQLPEEVAPGFAYIAAKAAASSGQNGIAADLIERTLTKGGSDPALAARAHYFRALLALGKRDYDAAEESLTTALQVDGAAAADVRDLAHLALARIAVHRRKPSLALRHYNAIDEVAPSYREALFESIYVHLDAGQDREARNRARVFVKQYPDGAEAFQIRVLLSMLDLRAGDLSGARSGIENTTQTLTSLTGWVDRRLGGKATLRYSELRELVDRTSGLIQQPAVVGEGMREFGRLAEIAGRLSEARGEIRNLTYTMGRASIEHLRPDLVARAAQLSELGEGILQTGHRLAAVERNLYGDRLDEIQKQELEASERRRTKLLTEPARMRRQLAQWASFADLSGLTTDLARTQVAVDSAEAELAASRFLSSNAENESVRAQRKREIEAQEARLGKARDQLARALEVIRKEKIRDLVAQSPHRALSKFVTQYATAIDDEAVVLSAVRSASDRPDERMLIEDSERAWRRWRYVSQKLHEQIAELETTIRQGLSEVLDEMAQQEARHAELSDKLNALTSALEGQLGRDVSRIALQYRDEIDRRLARQQKWNADIDWISYTDASRQRESVGRRADLERQILRDNLKDLEQGALWNWPQP